jgi:hypothetical protein
MRLTRRKVLPGDEEPPIPKGVALVEAAQQAVREFLAEATGELWKDDLDTIDVVYRITPACPETLVCPTAYETMA